MSDQLDKVRVAAFRDVIGTFLQERLADKLEKLKENDPKRQSLEEQFQWPTWIEDAARRVTQIQAVTHSLKAIHPDARGSNLYCDPAALPHRDEVGSHCLDSAFAVDVVGNAAALDVYSFLRLSVKGVSLLNAMQQGDAALKAALSEDEAQAARWIEAFLGLYEGKGEAASHARGKQLYWLTGDDPRDNDQYHLLAPLYPTSLVHRLYEQISEDRFGETAQEARKARREHRTHEAVLHDYPDLAVQKLGGTKPQNISQLNSVRGGQNYLLASLPPLWDRKRLSPPLNRVTLFDRRLLKVGEIWTTLDKCVTFLKSRPQANADTRDKIDNYLDIICGDLVNYARLLQNELPYGWSLDPQCQLAWEERLWLDPGRADSGDADDLAFRDSWLWMDWPRVIAERFASWLKEQLGEALAVLNDGDNPLGDAEHRHLTHALLLDEAWAARLHEMRRNLNAPTYIPTRLPVSEEML